MEVLGVGWGGRGERGYVCSSPLCGFCSANQTTCLKDSGIQELSASSSHSTAGRGSLRQTIHCAGGGRAEGWGELGGLKTLSIHNTVQHPSASPSSLPNLSPPPPRAPLVSFLSPSFAWRWCFFSPLKKKKRIKNPNYDYHPLRARCDLCPGTSQGLLLGCRS